MTRHVSTVEMTTDIVSALVSRTSVEATDLPDVVRVVKETLAGLAAIPADPVRPTGRSTPAIAVKRSVCEDHLVCLEDGLGLVGRLSDGRAELRQGAIKPRQVHGSQPVPQGRA
jgi:predicted transcriptional regulator